MFGILVFAAIFSCAIMVVAGVTDLDCTTANSIWPAVFTSLTNCCTTSTVDCNGASNSTGLIDSDDCFVSCNSNGLLDRIKIQNTNLAAGVVPNFNNLGSLTTFQQLIYRTVKSVADDTVFVDIRRNQIDGPIPTLPFTTSHAYFDCNALSGAIPPLPNNIIEFCSNSNQHTGSLPEFNTPSSPRSMRQTIRSAERSHSRAIPNLPSSLTTGNFDGNCFSPSSSVTFKNSCPIASTCSSQADCAQHNATGIVDCVAASSSGTLQCLFTSCNAPGSTPTNGNTTCTVGIGGDCTVDTDCIAHINGPVIVRQILLDQTFVKIKIVTAGSLLSKIRTAISYVSDGQGITTMTTLTTQTTLTTLTTDTTATTQTTQMTDTTTTTETTTTTGTSYTTTTTTTGALGPTGTTATTQTTGTTATTGTTVATVTTQTTQTTVTSSTTTTITKSQTINSLTTATTTSKPNFSVTASSISTSASNNATTSTEISFTTSSSASFTLLTPTTSTSFSTLLVPASSLTSTPLVTTTTLPVSIPSVFSADDIANQMAAGAIPPYNPLLPIDAAAAQRVVDSTTALLKNALYKVDPLSLTQSLGLMIGSLYPSQTFSFAAVPLNASTPFGQNGAVYVFSFSQYSINNVVTSSSRQGILTTYNASALQLFLPLELECGHQYQHGTYSLVNFNLAVSSSGKKRAPGVATNIINGASPLFALTTPLNDPRFPVPIPTTVTGRPLVNATRPALTDQDFVNNATLIVDTVLPACASPCESLIPNFATFKYGASIDTLNSTCQLVTPTNLTSYTNCAANQPSCNTRGISGVSLAKEFALLFEDLCTRYIQPTPSVTAITKPSHSHSTKHQPNTSSTSNTLSQTSTAAHSLVSPRRRDVITLDSTPQISYDGCGPVIAHMKYDLCEGSVVNGNGCNGNVTAHLKYPEVDLTKIPGSGYDGQTCKAAPIGGGGGVEREEASLFQVLALVFLHLLRRLGIVRALKIKWKRSRLQNQNTNNQDSQNQNSNSGSGNQQVKATTTAGSLVDGTGSTSGNGGVQAPGGVSSSNGDVSQLQPVATDTRPKSPGIAAILNGGSDILVNQAQGPTAIPATSQLPQPAQEPVQTIGSGNNQIGGGQSDSVGTVIGVVPSNAPIVGQPVILQGTTSITATSNTVVSIASSTITRADAGNAAATTTVKKSDTPS
ncbi:hypothetical protein BCR33DRAFT_857843 [Rhizoclosmatium globosum]|uniref:Extracellular membrane protein CFEM domain-containing protein n=1 Tax=Rhizoclosmatium globosum TaxID=329046 RepID=A0A1Y2B4S4_9FUNG|nr:hypothetical protein BCR33DRAFT_857843 [Rhizoclosmatium globosum]|eukprot:ORY29085.1 hypothetical protein BCR33DRAFT_857843 [Rhizoclosmatium globosum]